VANLAWLAEPKLTLRRQLAREKRYKAGGPEFGEFERIDQLVAPN
jgi:hypothetical protein